MIIKTYSKIFASLYQWNLEEWEDETLAAYLTAFGLCGGVVATGAVVLGALGKIYWGDLPTWLVVATFAAVFLSHYYLFVRGQRFRGLYAEFKTESSAARRTARVMAWVFLATTYGIIPLMAVVVLFILYG